MGEATRNDCSRCRERRSTNKPSEAKGPGLYRTAIGIFLLLVMMTLAIVGFNRMHTNDGPLLRRTLSNVIGHLGFNRQEQLDTLNKGSDMYANIDALQSTGTGVQSSEQLRHRSKRHGSGEDADTSRSNGSDADDSRSIHSETQSPTETELLADFKERINRATSFDEIRTIVESKDDALGLNRSTTTQSRGHRRRKGRQCLCRSRSSLGAKASGSTTTTKGKKKTELEQLVKVVRKNATCQNASATIVSEFGLVRNQEDTIFHNVCGPVKTSFNSNAEDWMKILSEAATNHSEWMKDIEKNSLCRPMEMILDLEAEQDLTPAEGEEFVVPFKALVLVKRCRPLYKGKDKDVTCVARKKIRKLFPIKHADVVKSFVLYDHIECEVKTDRSTVVETLETTTTTTYNTSRAKGNSKKIQKKSCPWPFQRKANSTRCSCTKISNGSPRYLTYLTCRNIQKGIWQLQMRQARCVRKGRCREPICDNGNFRTRLGRCPRSNKRKPNTNCRGHKPKIPHT